MKFHISNLYKYRHNISETKTPPTFCYPTPSNKDPGVLSSYQHFFLFLAVSGFEDLPGAEWVSLTVILRYSSSNISKKISSPFQKKEHGHEALLFGALSGLVLYSLSVKGG